jgi:hypothetical protein
MEPSGSACRIGKRHTGLPMQRNPLPNTTCVRVLPVKKRPAVFGRQTAREQVEEVVHRDRLRARAVDHGTRATELGAATQ